jgi:tellurite resistance protein TerC
MPVTNEFEGTRLFTRVSGRRAATPLAAAFLLVAVFDLVFAVDSIPAILAITREPFVVFAANAFALLGLRSLFFLVTGTMARIRYLNAGLGAILVFVGVKMLIADWWKIPVWISLPVILGILGLTALASALADRLGSRSTGPAAQRISKPVSPSGSSASTSTQSTRAPRGPSRT